MANAKDMIMRAVTGFHRAVFQVSNGRLANRGSGMPVLQLTTTGRKSGKRRTTMLTSPVQDGDRIVVVPRTAATTANRSGCSTCGTTRRSRSRWTAGRDPCRRGSLR